MRVGCTESQALNGHHYSNEWIPKINKQIKSILILFVKKVDQYYFQKNTMLELTKS